MAKRELPTIEILHKLLVCDAIAGKLYWRERDVNMFKLTGVGGAYGNCCRWNARFSGKEAFTTNDGDGYLTGEIYEQKFRAHRIVWAMNYGEWPNQIDHLNGIRKDNRLKNLRSVTSLENSRNNTMPINNTSGVCGVGWYKSSGKWVASIGVYGRRVHLGYFTDINDATDARKSAEKKYGFSSRHGKSTSAS